MDINSDKYYPYGISGHNYLVVHGRKLFHYQTIPDHSIQVIECNLDEKSMKVTTKTTGSTEWREIDISELKNGESIQCNEGKNHWEGGSLKGVPFGFGCYYNAQNKILYSGFMYEGNKVCTGVDYNEMTGFVEYEGNYYLNERHGYGKCYNEKGELIYQGNWYFGSRLENRWNSITTSKNKQEEIDYDIRNIVIDEYSSDCIVMNGFTNLYRVEILKNICQNVKTLEISNCNELNEFKINYKREENVKENVEQNDTENMEQNDTKNKTAYDILYDRLHQSDDEMQANDDYEDNDESDNNEDSNLQDTPIDNENEQDIQEEVQDEESDEEESEEEIDNTDYNHYLSSYENIFMIHHCSNLKTIDYYSNTFNNSIYCVRLFGK